MHTLFCEQAVYKRGTKTKKVFLEIDDSKNDDSYTGFMLKICWGRRQCLYCLKNKGKCDRGWVSGIIICDHLTDIPTLQSKQLFIVSLRVQMWVFI